MGGSRGKGAGERLHEVAFTELNPLTGRARLRTEGNGEREAYKPLTLGVAALLTFRTHSIRTV
jgi:hypothetical protein